MKKLLVVALGLGIVFGTVSFAKPQDGDKKMEKKAGKKKAKKADESK